MRSTALSNNTSGFYDRQDSKNARRKREDKDLRRKSFSCGLKPGVFSSSFLSSFFFHYSWQSTAVVDRCCLYGLPFTDAYRYTLSHYYRNHSTSPTPGAWPTFSQCIINDSYNFPSRIISLFAIRKLFSYSSASFLN